MAITGRKPKPHGQANNRHPLVHPWTDVVDVPFTGGPVLPEFRCTGQEWREETRATWAAWSSMPHCVLWRDADWSFALDSLELAARVHAGSMMWCRELRERERVMGTTVEYRRDIRIRYVTRCTQPRQQPAASSSLR